MRVCPHAGDRLPSSWGPRGRGPTVLGREGRVVMGAHRCVPARATRASYVTSFVFAVTGCVTSKPHPVRPAVPPRWGRALRTAAHSDSTGSRAPGTSSAVSGGHGARRRGVHAAASAVTAFSGRSCRLGLRRAGRGPGPGWDSVAGGCFMAGVTEGTSRCVSKQRPWALSPRVSVGPSQHLRQRVFSGPAQSWLMP